MIKNELNCVDFWRLDQEGLMRETTVLRRSLPAIAAIQEKVNQATA